MRDARGVCADGCGHEYAGGCAGAGVVVAVADDADLELLQQCGTAQCTRTSLVVGGAFLFFQSSEVRSVFGCILGANNYVI